MHGSSHMPELNLDVCRGYFTAFCTSAHNVLSDKLHLDFSSSYYIYPQICDVIQPDFPHVIPYVEGYLGGKEPHHQWYLPEI